MLSWMPAISPKGTTRTASTVTQSAASACRQVWRICARGNSASGTAGARALRSAATPRTWIR